MGCLRTTARPMVDKTFADYFADFNNENDNKYNKIIITISKF